MKSPPLVLLMAAASVLHHSSLASAAFVVVPTKSSSSSSARTPAYSKPYVSQWQGSTSTRPSPSFFPRVAATSSLWSSSSSSSFGSDFASAMPEAPKKTLREHLIESADKCLSNIRGSLGEGVEPVPEIAALQTLVDNANDNDNNADDVSNEDLSIAIYELMIERGMTYDEDGETGTLTPTEFDVKANLDVPEVKEEFSYLYRYGMTLIGKGLVRVDNIKRVVQERLISRTGFTPEEFDAWLGF